MPLVLHDPEIDAVVGFLRMQSGEVSARQIRNQFTPPRAERTVQRMLAELLDLGLLTATGKRRLRRYRLRTKPGPYGTVMWLPSDSNAAAMIASEQQLPATATPAPKTTKPADAPPAATTKGSSAKTESPGAAASSSRAARPSAATLNSQTTTPSSSSTALPTTKTIPPSRVQPILDRVLPNLLGYRITPDRVLPEMKLPAVASFTLLAGETPEDAAMLVTAALDQLSATEAAKFGCDAARFAEWRSIYWPAGYALTPPPASAPLPPLNLPNSITPERANFFLREVQHVVTSRMKPEALRPYLETQKGWLRGTETIDDWFAVLNAELNRLRLEDAIARKIRPEQYRLWRKEAWPVQ